ncbi:ENTH/VHS/GAT family protein [Corchorus olitorius]|uniref:ENTH/VHS/GAT family protein n=1 Tax=Corchorus olitorius TaxID=93759 RepID=A0A1R3HQE1_9ROSI|nr:ENTH/VHS/GAT family protein [Corchorus olitorius]
MTTLWKRAAGAIKDKNSIVVANLCRKNAFRNSDLESAIIKATSHDEDFMDKKNAQRVFSWIRASPLSLRTVRWALSKRMEKTRSWVVAIKGLMLMHGVINCKVVDVQQMGRLPFDLSNFSDGYSKATKMFGFNSFIRAYFAFLDQRAVVSFEQENHNNKKLKSNDNHDPEQEQLQRPLMVQQLLKLQKLQSLLDLLMQVRPQADNMRVDLILAAMDCIITEIFNIYGRICSDIAKVLLNIYSVGKLEAAIALKILLKARVQGEELSLFFEFCKDYGILNANEFPIVAQIPDEDIEEFERIINGVPETNKEENQNMAMVLREENNAIVEQKESKAGLQTIITEKWVIFDENMNINNGETIAKKSAAAAVDVKDLLPLVPIDVPVYNNPFEIPDLITF